MRWRVPARLPGSRDVELPFKIHSVRGKNATVITAPAVMSLSVPRHAHAAHDGITGPPRRTFMILRFARVGYTGCKKYDGEIPGRVGPYGVPVIRVGRMTPGKELSRGDPGADFISHPSHLVLSSGARFPINSQLSLVRYRLPA